MASKISISFLCLALFLVLILPYSYAQNSPQDYVNKHNIARCQVGQVNVTWDTTLATYAQNYANQRVGDCNLVHSGGQYGENLAKGYSSSSEFTGAQAVDLWVGEKQYYNYASNTCATGKVCGHYTQVVWCDSTLIGCGRAKCTNGWWYIVCSYNPPGNWQGEKPY